MKFKWYLVKYVISGLTYLASASRLRSLQSHTCALLAETSARLLPLGQTILEWACVPQDRNATYQIPCLHEVWNVRWMLDMWSETAHICHEGYRRVYVKRWRKRKMRTGKYSGMKWNHYKISSRLPSLVRGQRSRSCVGDFEEKSHCGPWINTTQIPGIRPTTEKN